MEKRFSMNSFYWSQETWRCFKGTGCGNISSQDFVLFPLSYGTVSQVFTISGCWCLLSAGARKNAHSSARGRVLLDLVHGTPWKLSSTRFVCTLYEWKIWFIVMNIIKLQTTGESRHKKCSHMSKHLSPTRSQRKFFTTKQPKSCFYWWLITVS